MRTLQNIDPTPEQLVILRDAAAGFRLIRGAAGSGKTTAALLRLRQLCASRISRKNRLELDDPVRVLVLTFNRTLKGYITRLVTEQVAASNDLDLTIETFAAWASNIIGRRQIIEHRPLIRELLPRIGVAEADLEYFVDEVEYIMGRFSPGKRKIYIEALRAGRGRAPTVTKKMRADLLTKVLGPYEERKSKSGDTDWYDIAPEAAASTSEGYDVVVVDECQDLSANQLRAILAHLKEDHVTTFIIDAVQRIYPQSFQWRDVGIEMRPQMVFSLTRNHRNTREIARFVSSLVRDLPPEQDGVLPDEEACQRTGPRPKVVAGVYRAQLDYMLDRVRPFLEADQTVALLQPKGGGWFRFAREFLRQREVAFCELTRNPEWPTGPEQVALSTIHSAKGLEFDHVLLPGLNQEVTPHGDEDGDGTLDSLRRLVAMGTGRARHTVTMGYKPGDQSTLIDLIDPATYDLVKV